MIRISELVLPLGSTEEQIEQKIRRSLRLKDGDSFRWEMLRHSVDARKKPQLFDVYTVGIHLKDRKMEERIAVKAKNARVRFEEPVRYTPPTPSNEADFYGFAADSEDPAAVSGSLSGTDTFSGSSDRPSSSRPVVVGFGPAGIFAALLLAEAGLRPLVLERGSAMEERVSDVEKFRESGILNPSSNIQFGEGGAGTFSDGKLSTGTKDREGRQRFVLETFHMAGAPESILTEQLPHIGTDLLRSVIVRIRERILEAGGEILFNTALSELLINDGALSGAVLATPSGRETIPVRQLILATGHSARDTFRMLERLQVPMQQKGFAVGFRISHPQSFINEVRYGISDPEELTRLGLPSASYKLTGHTSSGRAVYSFCMCPGGYIVNASSEQGMLAVNGMSDYARDSARANSAIVAAVDARDFGDASPLAGMYWQERLEKAAYNMAGGLVPIESWPDFRAGQLTGLTSLTSLFERSSTPDQESQTDTLTFAKKGSSFNCCKTDSDRRILTPEECRALCLTDRAACAPLHTLLPAALTKDLREAIQLFDRTLPGFAADNCFLAGLESRTSSPVRLPRDAKGESEIRGLFPAGEGAGYAGGIMSAAVDGMKAAEAVITSSAVPPFSPSRRVWQS